MDKTLTLCNIPDLKTMKKENKNKKVTLKTKTYSTKTKAIAKKVYDEVIAKYPNLMEKLKNS